MSQPNRIFLTELNQSHSEPNQFFFQKAKLKKKKLPYIPSHCLNTVTTDGMDACLRGVFPNMSFQC